MIPAITESQDRLRVGDLVRIRRRGKGGTYTAEWTDGMGHRRKSLHTRNKKIAISRAEKLESTLAMGTLPRHKKAVRITDAIDLYIAYLKGNDASRKTVVKYQAELRTLASFAAGRGATTLLGLTALLHDAYRAERQKTLAPYTLANHTVIHKGFLKWCVGRELAPHNPLSAVKCVKPKRAPKYAPSMAVVDQLLGAADPWLAAILATLAFSGLRSGELQALRPQDIDLDANWIQVCSREGWTSKTGSSRKIPIHGRLRSYLEKLAKGKRPCFFTEPPDERCDGPIRPVDTGKLNDRLKELAGGLGIVTGRSSDGLVIHSLRHFFETFTANNHVPQRVIDTWMGHTGDRSMGNVYYRLGDEESQQFMKHVPFGQVGGTPP